MQLQVFKRDVENRTGAFGYVAVAPIFAIQHVADVGVAIRFILHAQANRTDQAALALQFDGQNDFGARPLRLRLESAIEKLPREVGRAGGPRSLGARPRVRGVFVNVVFVVRTQCAE